MIKTEVIDSTTYYTTQRRGIEYMTYKSYGNEWALHSRRLSLGRSNVGTYKFFNTLKEVCENCKAFAGLDLLVTE